MKKNAIVQVRQGFRRSLEVRAGTLNSEARTVEAVVTTEAPVDMFWGKEALLMSGASFPAQVPLLNAHNRSSVDNVLGSVRDLRVDGTRLLGTLHFARSADADAAIDLIEQGHLTDVSVGYRIDDEIFVPRDESAIVEGKTFTGPVYVVKSWTAKEVSLVPIGADEAAKLRGFYAGFEHTDGGRETMDPKEKETIEETPKGAARGGFSSGERDEHLATIDNETLVKRGEEVERKRAADITEWCKVSGLTSDDALEYIRAGKSVDDVRADILKKREAQAKPTTTRVEVTGDAKDKFRSGAVNGLLIRAGVNFDALFGGDSSRVSEARRSGEPFVYRSIRSLARECLELSGVRAPYDDTEMLELAMRRTSFLGKAQGLARSAFGSRGDYGQTTSDLPNILLDAVNKAAYAGYQEADVTYDRWVEKVSFSDFKTRYVVKMGGLQDLALVSESGEVTQTYLTDSKESYAIGTYARKLNITRQVLINDDLQFLTSVPRKFGAASRRTVQKLVSDILNNGQTSASYSMADGKALFDASNHANYTTGAGTTLQSSTLETGINAMLNQTETINIAGGTTTNKTPFRPVYLIVPPALQFTAAKLLESPLYSDSSNPAGQINPLRGMLQIIVDPYLTSTTAWVLSSSPMEGAGIEVGFLNGVEAPTVQESMPDDILGMQMLVYLDAGAAPVEHRALYKSKGAA